MPNAPTRPVVAVGVVVLKGDQVLLIQRKNPPEQGHWSLPGGKQDLGEPVRETARREVLEETAIQITAPTLLDVVDGLHHDAKGAISYHYTLVDFYAHWASGEPVPGDDAADAQWIPLSNLGKMGLWSETEHMIRLAKNLSDAENR